MDPAYEKLGLFYLGRPYDLETGEQEGWLLYDSRDLVTHGLIVGMTGSGKTGLGIGLLEEAAIDGIPALVIDPKGDMGNLMLTFPELAAEDFRPWVAADDAARKGMGLDELAARTAEKWREGLAGHGQSPDRIRRLREACEVTIYTPGSTAGVPLAVFSTLAAPPQAVVADRELLLERVATTSSSLLELLGIGGDAVRSREHILVSTILDEAWSAGNDVDLPGLIQQVQSPPFDRVGVMELEAFFPAKERFDLAMAINNLLASPSFATFLEGEPMDIDRLLYTSSGKPRLAVVSIAHLSEKERMFVVALLLDQVLAWTRSRSGTSSLRALVYMDEIFGYLPPVAEPPSKRPLLTLLKQARAFGVGLLLATQNPVDLDYKALSNIGTWFLGRLQTERDKRRLLDGLEGADGGSGMSREEIDSVLGALPSRVFLLRNVHQDEPVLFQTRWVMSYLKGPMTRQEIKRLTESAGPDVSTEQPTGPARPPTERPPTEAPSATSPAPSSDAAGGDEAAAGPPLLPPDIPVRFAPSQLPGLGPPRLRPLLVGSARVLYRDERKGVEHREEATLATDVPERAEDVDWGRSRPFPWPFGALSSEPVEEAHYAPLPEPAAREKSFQLWGRRLAEHLYDTSRLTLLSCPTLDLLSRPGEDERSFRIRLAEGARDARWQQIEDIRRKFAELRAKLDDRIERAGREAAEQRSQLREQTVQTAISFGTTVMGALFGRKKLGSGTFSRAGTAARGLSRRQREAADVEHAEAEVAELEQEKRQLDLELDDALRKVERELDPHLAALEEVTVKPLKRNIDLRAISLVWAPDD